MIGWIHCRLGFPMRIGRKRALRALSFLNILVGLFAVSSQARAGTVLITEQEARLPPENFVVGSRGITRGPRIELIHPGETAHSPMHFQLNFKSFGGARIDTGSLRMVYLKSPEIDITPRVARFAQPAGIDIPDAEMPAGEHYIRVEVTDSEGRTINSIFVLKITP
jgi:hypothetical protein